MQNLEMKTYKAVEQSNVVRDLDEEISIGNYVLDLIHPDRAASINVKLEFRTSPINHVFLCGTVVPGKEPFSLMVLHGNKYQAFVEGVKVGNIVLRKYDEKTGAVQGVFLGETVFGDRSVYADRARFLIQNLREIGGRQMVYEDGSFNVGHYTFDDGKFEIQISRNREFNLKMQAWQDFGGAFWGYSGEVKKKGSSISFEEVNKVLKSFGSFLTMINGATISPLVVEGIARDGSQLLWRDFSAYANSNAIFSNTHGLLQSKTYLNLNTTWQNFRKLETFPKDKSFLNSALKWYIEANSSTSLEASIVISQTCLELIYNWLVVEKRQMLAGKDASNILAANKLRLLNSIIDFKIDLRMLPALADGGFQKSRDKDIFNIIVGIRNALVHGEETKRESIESLLPHALHQARELLLYMIEMALLFILGYEGRYCSRFLVPEVRAIAKYPVPWHRLYDKIMWNIETGKYDPDLAKAETDLLYGEGSHL